MADVQTSSLYEEDFYLWALGQARALRALRDAASGQGDLKAALNAIDWDNAIEELEGLAKGVRSELRSRMITIIQHLIKLELSGATDPRHGRRETVRRSRLELELVLSDNHSLRREVAPIVAAPIMRRAATDAVDDLVSRGEIPRGTPAPVYTVAQLVEDWWPTSEEAKP